MSDSQPTPESNIEVCPCGFGDLHSDGCRFACDYTHEICLQKIAESVADDLGVQALLTAADQAGYTRGREEAKISPIIEMPLDITGFQLIGYFGKDGGEWRSVIFGTEVLPAQLQKEADNG